MLLDQVTILDTTDNVEINLRDPNIQLKGLYFGTLSTATTFTLQASPDAGTTFYSILDTSGAAVEFTLLADGMCYVPIDESYTTGIKYFKIVMADAVSADRTVTPVGQRLMYQ